MDFGKRDWVFSLFLLAPGCFPKPTLVCVLVLSFGLATLPRFFLFVYPQVSTHTQASCPLSLPCVDCFSALTPLLPRPLFKRAHVSFNSLEAYLSQPRKRKVPKVKQAGTQTRDATCDTCGTCARSPDAKETPVQLSVQPDGHSKCLAKCSTTMSRKSCNVVLHLNSSHCSPAPFSIKWTNSEVSSRAAGTAALNHGCVSIAKAIVLSGRSLDFLMIAGHG